MDAQLLVESKMMVAATFGLDGIPKEPLVTIASAGREEQQKDKKGKAERWGILRFREPWAKPLKVNATSRKALILMFGGETDAWVGKRIGLFALPGIYFGEPGVAVRIKGSPDIKEACSFQVRKYGGGTDTYNLIVMGGGGSATAAAPKPWPKGEVGFGPKKGVQILQLTYAENEEVIALGEEQLTKFAASQEGNAGPTPPWVGKTVFNLEELRANRVRLAELERQIASGLPPPVAAEQEDAPV